MSQRRRIALSAVVFVVAFGLCLVVHFGMEWPSDWFPPLKTSGDLYFPLCGARALLAGQSPYTACSMQYGGRNWPTNPLTTVLPVVPFLVFGDYAGATIYALCSALLAYGLLRNGESWRLLALVSVPYVHGLFWLQWSPLIAAIALLPSLLPLALVKPHTGLAVILCNLTRRRLIGLLAFAALSVVVFPAWPWQWLRTLGSFDGFSPALMLPFGPLALLGLVAWRNPKARLLVLSAFMPQRPFYDLLILWTCDLTKLQTLGLTIVSWGAFALYQAKLVPTMQYHEPPLLYACAALFLAWPVLRARFAVPASARLVPPEP